MDWEFYILNYIRENMTSDILNILMPVVSMAGNGVLWALAAIVCLIIPKTRLFGRTLTFDLIFGVITCNLILKTIVQRIRPYDLNSTVSLIVNAETDFSFPSGHTFFSFTVATIIFLYNKKWGVIAYLFALTVAFSRLYLYVHFPTDVICGAIFGVLTAIAVYHFDKMLFSDNNRHQLLSSSEK